MRNAFHISLVHAMSSASSTNQSRESSFVYLPRGVGPISFARPLLPQARQQHAGHAHHLELSFASSARQNVQRIRG